MFIVTPILLSDFDQYVKMMVTVVTSICWLITLVIITMIIKILVTLRRRNIALKTQFNAAETKQGVILIKQNKRLAMRLIIFVGFKVLATLPLYTSYIVILYCNLCFYPGIYKFTFYMTLVFQSLVAIFPAYWLRVLPPYYKALRKLSRKLFCQRRVDHLNNDNNSPVQFRTATSS